ncbi:WD40-repeat-containing domain protein, partial [Gorgonomyces haynaldii]
MFSALAWVRKGAAAAAPTKQVLTDEEFERIKEQLGHQVEDAKQDLEEAQTKTKESDDVEDIYNLHDYDNETSKANPLFTSVKGLAYYENNEEDPYIQGNEEEEEQEELMIESSDNLILAAKTEDDISHVEVYVYEEEEDNLYVHHDILLPSFPLCLEWIDFPTNGKDKGNFVAIGTFDPQVEIWDLDIVDAMFPQIILGQIPDPNLKVGGKKKAGPARVAKRVQAERHVDAVMSISWNKTQKNLVATGSADTTIKLWDLNRPSAAITHYTHHKDKVQAVCWNTLQPTVLLSGGYDKRAFAFDSRDPNSIMAFDLTADVECLLWDPIQAERFYVSTEDGIVGCFDARSPNQTVFTLHAHDDAVSALDVSPHLPGCLVTGSADKTVKIWNIKDDKPTNLVSRDIGAVLSLILGKSLCYSVLS